MSLKVTRIEHYELTREQINEAICDYIRLQQDRHDPDELTFASPVKFSLGPDNRVKSAKVRAILQDQVA